MATPAKTARKSLGKSFRNTLSLPFKLTWPTVTKKITGELLFELVRALNGVRLSGRKQRSKRRLDESELEHQPKRQRMDKDGNSATSAQQTLLVSETSKGTTSSISPEELAAKRSQFVVGVNQVTRGMERASLRAVVVCRSEVKSRLLHDHLQFLSATRDIPSVAVHGLSEKLAPALGLKRVTTIGIKKLSSSDAVDHFAQFVSLIASRAPKIDIPWLQLQTRSSSEHCTQSQVSQSEEKFPEPKIELDGTEGYPQETTDISDEKANWSLSEYLPLAIKKTIITPKRRK